DELTLEGDLVIERLVRVREVLDLGVEPLVVLEELAHLLRARLEVADELRSAIAAVRSDARLAIVHRLRDARGEVVERALVRLSSGRLVDDDERRAPARPAELMFECLETRAVAGEKLEELAP